jgi:hypothetical protein
VLPKELIDRGDRGGLLVDEQEQLVVRKQVRAQVGQPLAQAAFVDAKVLGATVRRAEQHERYRPVGFRVAFFALFTLPRLVEHAHGVFQELLLLHLHLQSHCIIIYVYKQLLTPGSPPRSRAT